MAEEGNRNRVGLRFVKIETPLTAAHVFSKVFEFQVRSPKHLKSLVIRFK